MAGDDFQDVRPVLTVGGNAATMADRHSPCVRRAAGPDRPSTPVTRSNTLKCFIQHASTWCVNAAGPPVATSAGETPFPNRRSRTWTGHVCLREASVLWDPWDPGSGRVYGHNEPSPAAVTPAFHLLSPGHNRDDPRRTRIGMADAAGAAADESDRAGEPAHRATRRANGTSRARAIRTSRGTPPTSASTRAAWSRSRSSCSRRSSAATSSTSTASATTRDGRALDHHGRADGAQIIDSKNQPACVDASQRPASSTAATGACPARSARPA